VTESNSLAESSMPRHKLHQVQPYIEESLRSDLSLQAIADMAGMSTSHLKSTATMFQRHAGVLLRRW